MMKQLQKGDISPVPKKCCKSRSKLFRSRPLRFLMLLQCFLLYFTLVLRGQELVLHNIPAFQEQPKASTTKSLVSVLKELKNDYHIDLIYSIKSVEDKYVKFNYKKEADFETTLQGILNEVGLNFKKVDELTYVIVSDIPVKQKNRGIRNNRDSSSGKSEMPTSTLIHERLISSGIGRMWSKDISVKGKVTAQEDGQPLPGVNVLVKGTSGGTTTNMNGEYSLNVSDANGTLVFSFIGFTTEEVPLNGRSNVDIAMVSDIRQLSEVVVVGYGKVKKSDLTGSVSSISTEELASVPVSSVEQMMQGRAAGVQITSSSGGPGAASSIKIRGVNSINSSSEPLYVIDGVPIAANSTGDISANGTSSNLGFSILSTINPGDIESIEVLKDASSTAIYGSRGANGVIIITTKSGKKGKSTIELNANYGFSEIPKFYDVLGREDFVNKFNEFAAIEGITPIPDDGSIALEDNNWMDIISRNGVTQNYQLSINGGDNKTQYYLSGSYLDQQGVIKESFLRRYNGRINAVHSPVEIVKIGGNFAYTRSEYALTNPEKLIANAVSFAPVIPQTDPDGKVFYPSYEYLNNGQIFSFNPLGYLYGEDRDNFNDRVLLNSYVNVDITKSLSLRSTIGIDLINSTEQNYVSKLSAGGLNTQGRATVVQGRTSSLININQVNYQKTFGSKHDFAGTLIHEVTKATSQDLVNNWDRFPTDALSFYGIGTGTTPAGIANNIREWTMISFASRINYNYDSKYLLTLTARRDGSSRFGTGNKWGFFPSGALAWRVSEESFIKSINAISNLKLRASFGITGNTDIGFYNSIVTIGTASDYSSGTNLVPYYFPQRIANKDLKWETTEQVNIGLDFGLFNNRININADYFNSKTNDLLLAVNIPENSGYSTILKNAGSVKNEGVELSLNAILIQNDHFNWDISSTFSRSVNKVSSLGGEHQVSVDGQTLFVGQPLQNQLGYQHLGIFQSEEEILTSPSRPNDLPGVPKYKDINQDGRIDGNDMITLGRGFPAFYYGLTSNFSYKNFDMFLYFNGVEGITLYNQTKFQLVADGGTNTLKEYYYNRWTPDNPTQEYPMVRPQIINRSSQFLEDATFLRLKTVTLGYNLPIQKLKWISKARIYVTGQNIFTVTSYTGYDPEVNSSGQSNVAPPIDNSAYPRARTFSLGANLTF